MSLEQYCAVAEGRSHEMSLGLVPEIFDSVDVVLPVGKEL
ncbi:hypothetical protein MTBLM1_70057 [Rhodospirillaceae bacterium LM-1]|nr:hypothetical protein MTBLM1_70057 [Rhodospirillaceae bacterium LM-1]